MKDLNRSCRILTGIQFKLFLFTFLKDLKDNLNLLYSKTYVILFVQTFALDWNTCLISKISDVNRYKKKLRLNTSFFDTKFTSNNNSSRDWVNAIRFNYPNKGEPRLKQSHLFTFSTNNQDNLEKSRLKPRCNLHPRGRWRSAAARRIK